ncbi:MAG TPA: large-conductance mechanosensitive channel protein MscL [Solimonas sp.]|jgi:large conductance mechanosensitive channel|nr:large-conductance mechanosensitive channel protein MscL [Solimonas sp.]
MSMMKEFKEFAMRGNVIDLAVGVVIGGAFGKIVSSLVADVIMPVIGVLIGGVDFSKLAITLVAAEGDKPAVLLGYGKFVQATFDFLIIAFAIFLFIKLINRLHKKKAEEPAAPPPPSAEQTLLTEIRDLLKQQRSGS